MTKLEFLAVKRIICAVAVLLAVFQPGPLQAGLMDQGLDLLKQAPSQKASTASSPVPAQNLTGQEMGAGLQEALRVGSENVVSRLGAKDGFNLDPQIHIPLPGSLNTVRKALSAVGKGAMLDDLELRLNRAAEAATPQARELFLDAIAGMTFADAQAIFSGPDDAATRYFQQKLTPALTEKMKPVVNGSLADVGAVQAYDNVMGQYRTLPLVPDVKANLTDYVTEKGLTGIFHYLAQEESAIRRNPVKRTTDLLQRVFGGR